MSHSKLLLVYPPLTIPTSPPLGIALLKAYVTAKLVNWQAEALDVNLLFFESVIRGMRSGEKLDLGLFPEGAVAEILLAGANEVFKTSSHAEFYANPSHYDLYADVFLKRFNKLYCGIMRGI